jgi:hypothetical protein
MNSVDFKNLSKDKLVELAKVAYEESKSLKLKVNELEKQLIVKKGEDSNVVASVVNPDCKSIGFKVNSDGTHSVVLLEVDLTTKIGKVILEEVIKNKFIAIQRANELLHTKILGGI